MDEVVGIDFGENWVSVDPSVDYDETVTRIQEVVDGYPGLYRDALDVPEGTHPGGPNRLERSHHSTHLRARPERPTHQG